MHEFKSGQRVYFGKGRRPGHGPTGEYKVVRPLPDSGGEPEYRIVCVREPHERVARESELEKL